MLVGAIRWWLHFNILFFKSCRPEKSTVVTVLLWKFYYLNQEYNTSFLTAPPPHTSVILACSFVTREENSVTRFFTPPFYDYFPSGPLFIFWSIFAYDLEFAEIFACAKNSTVSMTPRSFFVRHRVTVKLVFIMTSGSF